MEQKLFIVRGLPGSGKSTLAKSLGVFHVEADMFFVTPEGEYLFRPESIGKAHEWCRKTVFLAINSGLSVVVSNTFTTKREIQPYINIAKGAGVEYEILTMNGQYGSIHNVPADVIEKMRARWEELD